MQLDDLLGIDNSWEWNRTHWTMKETNLEESKPYLQGKDVTKPEIFLSYSWNPPEHKLRVENLIKKLEKDGVSVRYDEKFLRPGHDIYAFMEKEVTSEDIDAVVIVSNREYADRADNRNGGVGYESNLIEKEIEDKPMQEKYIPVVFGPDENGNLPLPKSLTSRYCIDLSRDKAYEELLEAIWSQNPAKRRTWLKRTMGTQ